MNSLSQKIIKKIDSDTLLNYIHKAPIGVLVFSAEWEIVFVNDNFINFGILYNFDASKLIGSNILDRDIFQDKNIKDLLLTLPQGEPFEVEIKKVRTLDRGLINLVVKGSPIFEEERFGGGILIIEDIKILAELQRDIPNSISNVEDVLSRTFSMFFITDAGGKIKYALGKHISNLSVPAQNLIDIQITSLFNNEALNKFIEHRKSVLENLRAEKFPVEIILGIEKFIFECTIEPLLIKGRHVKFLFFFFNDITEAAIEKRRLESELSELRQYQALTEAVTDAVFAVDINGQIIFWNKASENLFGFSKSEVYGKFFGRVLGLFEDAYFERINEELEKYSTWKSNITVFKKDGVKEIIEAKFTLTGEKEKTIIVLCSNITARAELEKQLRLSEEKFRNIVTQAAELICNVDPDGRITYANPMFIDSFKYSEDEILTKKITDLLDAAFLKKHPFSLKDSEKEKNKLIELTGLTKHGEKIYLFAKISPVYFDNRVIKYFHIFFTDISDKKLAEKNLEIYRSVFEASQEGITVVSDGKILLANKSFADIFGYENTEEVTGKEFLDLVSSSDVLKAAEHLQAIDRRSEKNSRVEFLGKRKDNSNFYSDASIAAFITDDTVYAVILIRDVTERKRAQQAIRESEEKYRNITENIDDFLFTLEKTGQRLRPMFYTASVEKITGYTQTEFMSDTKIFLKIIHPDDFNEVIKKIKNLTRSRIQLSDELEFRIINKHGNIVWARAKVNIIRDREGKIQKVYGLVSDISFRKKAEEELKKSTENLIKLNETKDKFLSIISHDLRTPFTSILGFTDLLLSDEDLSEKEKKQYIGFIQESSKSMLELVNSLLDWTRLQTGRIKFEPEIIKANEVIENSLNALSGTAFQKKINLISEIDDELMIFADKNLIGQVFNNLISNAIKFTNEGRKITISANPSSQIRFVEFSVKDSGVGIKEENLKDLFKIDAKFTTEGTAGEKGSGFGLSLVKEIIEKHSGSIRVESEFGKGSNFIFTVPISPANILLVDDSKTDRLLYSKILKNIVPDYTIELASDGIEALEKIKNTPPALVITDHVMPEMNGYELVKKLLSMESIGKINVIILSSDIDRQAIEDYNNLGIKYVFQKPVNLSNFKQAVEKSLRKGL
jgi:PAS domain S-box-containing protein